MHSPPHIVRDGSDPRPPHRHAACPVESGSAPSWSLVPTRPVILWSLVPLANIIEQLSSNSFAEPDSTIDVPHLAASD
jgi:hypothetical protein